MGWFDGNPGRLWAHPPEAIGPRYVEAMGGIDRVVELAQQALRRRRLPLGGNAAGPRDLHRREPRRGPRRCTPTPSSSWPTVRRTPSWRNFFLSGATELREGNFGTPDPDRVAVDHGSADAGADVRHASPSASTVRGRGTSTWPSTSRSSTSATNYRLTLRNGVLVHRKVAADESTAAATITLANKTAALGVRRGRH